MDKEVYEIISTAPNILVFCGPVRKSPCVTATASSTIFHIYSLALVSKLNGFPKNLNVSLAMFVSDELVMVSCGSPGRARKEMSPW